MPRKLYVVTLTEAEREMLRGLARGARAAHKRQRAAILLKTDEGEEGPGWCDAAIVEAFALMGALDEALTAKQRVQAVELVASWLSGHDPEAKWTGLIDAEDSFELNRRWRGVTDVHRIDSCIAVVDTLQFGEGRDSDVLVGRHSVGSLPPRDVLLCSP